MMILPGRPVPGGCGSNPPASEVPGPRLWASSRRIDKAQLEVQFGCAFWEEPGNQWLSYVVDDATGEIAATAIFGPGLVLLVTVSDGRRLCFPVPEFYREPLAGVNRRSPARSPG